MISVNCIDVLKSGSPLYQNFSWDIEDGDNWVITGNNGSGKTTLLEVLAGKTRVTKGEIAYDFITGGNWDERYAEKSRKITYIPAHALQTFTRDTHDMYY